MKDNEEEQVNEAAMLLEEAEMPIGELLERLKVPMLNKHSLTNCSSTGFPRPFIFIIPVQIVFL